MPCLHFPEPRSGDVIKRLQAVLVAQPRAEVRSLCKTLTLSLLLFAASQAQAGACTREYMPVCGQLPAKTQTFSNRCMMKNAGAVMLHEGVCKPKPLTKDDHGNGRAVWLNKGQWPKESHIKLTVLWKRGLIVARA